MTRVEIKPDRPRGNTGGKLFCLLLDRAAGSVKSLNVSLSAYAEGVPDDIEGSESFPYYGRSIKFAGDSWAAGKQIVVVAEGPDAEEAGDRVSDALHRSPPSLSSFGIGPYPHQQPPTVQQMMSENKRRYAEYLRLRKDYVKKREERENGR